MRRTKKQTPIEWLMTQVVTWDLNNDPNKPSLESLLSRAKEMEYEQIIDAFSYAYLLGKDVMHNYGVKEIADEYYEKTFNLK